jgi:hypothetical protein
LFTPCCTAASPSGVSDDPVVLLLLGVVVDARVLLLVGDYWSVTPFVDPGGLEDDVALVANVLGLGLV